MKKARLYQVRRGEASPSEFIKMWVFECPCEPRPWRYWHFAAAYGTMLWHFHLYHRRST
jgi:hypothetical protein